jgi:hypothetical protein
MFGISGNRVAYRRGHSPRALSCPRQRLRINQAAPQVLVVPTSAGLIRVADLRSVLGLLWLKYAGRAVRALYIGIRAALRLIGKTGPGKLANIVDGLPVPVPDPGGPRRVIAKFILRGQCAWLVRSEHARLSDIREREDPVP